MNGNLYRSHEISILNRNSLSISGIKKIITLESDNFLVDSICGRINIKGNNLEVLMLDTDKGDLKLKGKVDSIIYSDSKKENKESILTKLFK